MIPNIDPYSGTPVNYCKLSGKTIYGGSGGCCCWHAARCDRGECGQELWTDRHACHSTDNSPPHTHTHSTPCRFTSAHSTVRNNPAQSASANQNPQTCLCLSLHRAAITWLETLRAYCKAIFGRKWHGMSLRWCEYYSCSQSSERSVWRDYLNLCGL